MQRARELIKPYVNMEGVIGIYVLGSSTRPFRDQLSDYDIEVVVADDAYVKLSDDQKHIVVTEGSFQQGDHEFYLRPWSELLGMVSSTRDLFHFPYQHAVVLHDPEGRLAGVIRNLAKLPSSVRRVRIRVHFLEFVFSINRASKASKRAGGLNLQLLYGQALTALIKLLFLVMGSWPASPHWSREELLILGVSDDLIDMISHAFSCPTSESMACLEVEIRKWLVKNGELFSDYGDDAFKDAYSKLVSWAYLTAEGKAAFETWASR